MSECVVRMEMPQNCCECQLRQEDYDAGEEFCPFTGVECLSIGRQDNCPIICALPENHGRLVDAASVESIIRKWFEEIKLNPDILLDGVKSLPTIVPAERRKP